jgi:NitT/TauT family transport system substrate-binding protein
MRLIAVLILLLAAGTAALALRSYPEQPVELRIGINPWPGYEPLFIARDDGLFAKHRLAIKLVEFTSVGDCLRGFQQGDVDGMTCTLVEVVLGRQVHLDRPPVPILVTDSSLGADVLLAQPEIASVSALRGRKIGVEAASLGIFILERALTKHGMNRTDVTIVALGQDEMAEALRSHRVDAIMTYAPYSIAASNQGARMLFSSREIPDEVVDVVAISDKILQTDPQVAERLRAVWQEVLAQIARDPAAAHARMAQRQKLTLAEFTASLDGIAITPAADQERLLAAGGAVDISLDQIARILAGKGGIP